MPRPPLRGGMNQRTGFHGFRSLGDSLAAPVARVVVPIWSAGIGYVDRGWAVVEEGAQRLHIRPVAALRARWWTPLDGRAPLQIAAAIFFASSAPAAPSSLPAPHLIPRP